MLCEGRDKHTWSLSCGPYMLASKPKLASAESDGENPASSHMKTKFNTPLGVEKSGVAWTPLARLESQQDSSPRRLS